MRQGSSPCAGTARAVAVGLLQAVLGRGQPFDEAFATACREGGPLARFAERDRGYARLLAATALRRLGQIDGLLAHCLEQPLPPRASPVMDALRLGACQILFLGTPAHAAVNESVKLSEELGHPRLKGLVNAVLRRIDREGPAMVADQDAPRLNTPPWLWRAWTRAYGAATCRRIAEADMEEAPLDLTPRRDAAVWAELLNATLLPTGSLRRPAGGIVSSLAGYAEGAWWVQDAAAALPVRLLGNVAELDAIDLCAAPGGKTAQLAAGGARVTAVDRSAARLAQLEVNLSRLGLAPAATICADAALWRPRRPAPAVLLDAPCTATGTARRHPDIPWRKTPEDVARLAHVQMRLLAAAVEMTARGGVLVYAVCSLQPEEGPERVAALIDGGAPVARVPIRPDEVPGLAHAITAEGDLRTLPCYWHGEHGAPEGGIDGFFVARLRRR